MKTILKYSLMMFAAVLGVACNRIKESAETVSFPEKEIVLTATREGLAPGTRSFRLDDGSVWWSPNEEVSVFYGAGSNGGSKFVSMNSAIAETVELQGSVQMAGSGKEFWAVYPYSEDNTCDGSSIITVIPDQQTGVEGNFSGDVFPTVAKSSSLSLAFWNICGGVKFFVSRNDIKSVTFNGNNNEVLAGTVKVSFGSDGTPVIQEVIDAKSEVTLVAPDGGTFKVGRYYYITLLPAELRGGITMVFETDNTIGTLVSDKAQTVKRSVFGVLKNIDSKVSEWETVWVDLGLSVKWATCNVGADKPSEYGDYFAWGEVQPKSDYTWSTYKWCNGSSNTQTKYNINSLYGTVDNKIVLDHEDDAACINLGDGWRMPTYEEWTELINNCTWTWTDDYEGTGVSGRIVTSNKSGYTDKSIFLPAAGDFYDGGQRNFGTNGFYWSSLLNTDSSAYASYVFFNSHGFRLFRNYRYVGKTIRPVYGEFIPVASITLDNISLELFSGTTKQLTATISPTNATNPSVRWASADESVARVDENGIVLAVAKGTTTVTAYASNGLNATCVVNVTGGSLKDFAQEFVKGLEVWENTVGTVDADWTHCTANGNAWQNVHFIPIVGNPASEFYYDTGNQYDPKWASKIWKLKVEGTEYSSSQAWEIAIRGLMNMCTAEGEAFLDGMTDRNKAYTVQDGLALSKAPISEPSKDNKWGKHPWYEGDNLVKDGGQEISEVGIDFMLKVGAWHVVRAFIRAGSNNPLGMIGNFQEFGTSSGSLNLKGDNGDYIGLISPMRELLVLMRIYKYLLDNNIDSNVYSAIKDRKFDFDLYGIVEPEAVDLGLSVKWATKNVGATKPEEYGDYFAWGETESKSNYDWSTYIWCNGSKTVLTKYNTKSSYGTVDNKTVLDVNDDVAHVNLGGNWRMPTYEEWLELVNNCTWAFTDNYNGTGIAGRIVTSNKNGYKDKAIFFPAAGYRANTRLYDVGSDGRYWSLSCCTDTYEYTYDPWQAWFVGFSPNGFSGAIYGREAGFSIRPVYGDRIHPESVTLNKSTLSLYIGLSEQLEATVLPKNTTEKSVEWTSSNTEVATVDKNGKVRAVATGSATITVTSNDGNLTTTCVVLVTGPIPDSEAVDLGLSVKWATFNVGATKPEEIGDYYAWGETSQKKQYDWSWSTYKWCKGNASTLTKYNTNSSYGTMDNKTVLDPEDDAAHENWGGNWRMPTYEEWLELRDNCTWTKTSNYNGTGVVGRIVTSNVSGYTDKSIFLPYTGYCQGSDYAYNYFYTAEYWSSSLANSLSAWKVGFDATCLVSLNDFMRFYGLSVRPIYPK